METVITAYIEDVFKMRVRDTLEFFKEYNIDVVNISFNYNKVPFKCVIKTIDTK